MPKPYQDGRDIEEELRTRLESVEAARRDAQESRFALIIQNEELGAELAATHARLENAEAAIRGALSYLADVGPHHLDSGMEDSGCDRVMTGLVAALAAAGERESRSDG